MTTHPRVYSPGKPSEKRRPDATLASPVRTFVGDTRSQPESRAALKAPRRPAARKFKVVILAAGPYSPHMVRVGIGYDVHALVEGRPLVLGGVVIPHSKGLDGHSDADALMHALCDAVLGAIGEGDIGQLFPNTDVRWKGAASRVFLEEAARRVAARGGRIVNVDASLIAEAPKMAPHIPAMKLQIAAALGLTPDRVGVKATTNERLGFAGRGEGIAAMAVASVDVPE